MKKITILIFLINVILFASNKTINAKYEITYGSILSLGEATTNLKIKNDIYEITIEARATGVAKFLTNNRIETYKSYGKIINNEFVPEKFIKIKQDSLRKRTRVYTFNNKDNKVHLNDKREEKVEFIDSNFIKKYKQINLEGNKTLTYYASQDILSLFFNLRNKIPTYKKEKNYELKAVGANKTKGIINIILPKNKIDELDTKKSEHLIAYINQKIFGSKRGELFLSLNKEGFCNKAILKDVVFFGDIVGEMVEFKTKG